MARENEKPMSKVKKERRDTLDAVYVGRESDKTDSSDAIPTKLGKRKRKHEKSKSKDCEGFDEEEKPKLHQREVESPPEECHEDVKEIVFVRHECSINAIYHKRKPSSLLRALKRCSCDYGDEPDSEMKVLSNELDPSKSDFTDAVFESVKRDPILKLPLPPEKIMRAPYMEWENDVDNPTIKAVDRSIRQIVDSVLLPRGRYESDLKGVRKELNEAVKFEKFTNCWTLIGSYLNGLVCLDSDINLHFKCAPENYSCDSVEPENMLKKVAAFINVNKKKFPNFKFNPCIRFPWVKTCSTRFKKEIEITFSTDLNCREMLVAKSSLMKFYLDMSPNLKYLTVMVRIILQKYRIHGTAAKFQTYTVFWLVVFFMQRKKLLPAVIDIRNATGHELCIEGWDCSLPESYPYPTEPVSLYSLLLEFFEYYKNFDFLDLIICPYVGRSFRSRYFDTLSQYMPQINSSRQLTFRRNVINLQDPCDLCQNVAEFIEPENANKFNIVCHRLSERFANSIERIQTMDCFCNDMLTTKDFYEYSPYNLTQYAVLGLRTKQFLNFDESRGKKLNQMHIEEAIRRMMESVFEFRRSTVVTSRNITRAVNKESNEVTIVQQTVPVIFFHYRSSKNTWKNNHIKEIIPRKEDEKRTIWIFLTCEVCLEKHFVNIFLQGEAHFVKFLDKHLLKILKFILEEIVS